MLKYEVGQEFITNRILAFPEGYDDLEEGMIFKIEMTMEESKWGKLECPYYVSFPNGFEIALSENDIEELSVMK